MNLWKYLTPEGCDLIVLNHNLIQAATIEAIDQFIDRTDDSTIEMMHKWRREQLPEIVNALRDNIVYHYTLLNVEFEPTCQWMRQDWLLQPIARVLFYQGVAIGSVPKDDDYGRTLIQRVRTGWLWLRWWAWKSIYFTKRDCK